MTAIDVKTFKEMDLEGGTVLEASPTVGLASTIACSYLVNALGLDQISAWDAEEFPPVSMIYARKPKFPARIYARADVKVAAFISEVPLPPATHRAVARQLLTWTQDQGCREIVTLEGLPAGEEDGGRPRLWGIGSTEAAQARLEGAGISQLEAGMITGISAVLLNEGRWRDLPVVCLLAESRPYLPDAEAAAKLVEGVDALLERVEIPTEPLYQEAREIQERIAQFQEQAEPALGPPRPEMYR